MTPWLEVINVVLSSSRWMWMIKWAKKLNEQKKLSLKFIKVCENETSK